MSQTTFPQVIHDPSSGDMYVLAENEADALQWALDNYGEDEIEGVTLAGWMCEVSYPDGYDSREEWEQSSHFCESWWEGCQTPVNDKQREHAKQSWEVRFR